MGRCADIPCALCYVVVTNLVSQMFIGHSQPINQVSFTPGQQGVVSVGDAIFLWDFLAHPVDLLRYYSRLNACLLNENARLCPFP